MKIAKILPTTREFLSALFEVLILSVSAQYRTVPDVAAIQKAIGEVFDAYPELRPESYNRQIAIDRSLLTDDAGFDVDDAWSQVWAAIGKTPEQVRERHRVGD